MNHYADLGKAIALLAVLALAKPASGNPYPLEYFALRDVMSNVAVSPSGDRVLLLQIPSRDGNPILEIYDAAKLASGQPGKPFRLDADPMEIVSAQWVSDRHVLLSLRQRVRERIEGFNQGAYSNKLALLNVDSEKVTELDGAGQVENVLPDQPHKVIISQRGSDSRAKSAPGFRPRNYYELDLRRGSKKLLLRGDLKRARTMFDKEGMPWLAFGVDPATGVVVWYHRSKGKWNEIHRGSEDSFESFDVRGFNPDNRQLLWVLAHNGHDRVAMWEYDAQARVFTRQIYAHPQVDVSGVLSHSVAWSKPDQIVAARYFTDKRYYEFVDAEEQATYRQLEQLIPEAHQISIVSRSRDGQALTIRNEGPTDPGSYYLLKDGRLRKVGSKQPLLVASQLAQVKYIDYQARDGMKLWGYLTIPNGDAPFPLVVLPHGGPFYDEDVVYDEWAQMLANNGYLVFQPQFRGTEGYGLDYYKTAFVNGGQGGLKMQDDKDDGALHLVEQGLADAERIAMFGWSYGGYAALIAAARNQQIYQCAIAGAPVADNTHQVNYYANQIKGPDRLEQLSFWRDSISPIETVSRINIPLMLIHGDIDQRVPIVHSRRYLKAATEDSGVEFVELTGADHFISSLFFQHQLKLYESIISFLQERCGPGGL